MKIIGAGFGRTGTLSLKAALERLGVGRCHHMSELFGNPGQPEVWLQVVEGKRRDWDAIFEGYGAMVDWPGCSFWRELMDHYPDATVLLSVRDPGRWHESVMNTIYNTLTAEIPADAPAFVKTHFTMARKLILEGTFDGRLADRDHAIAVFEAHNEEVKRTVPAERLLVFEASQGWEPLCRVLGVDVPAEPYPRVNSTDDFKQRMRAIAEAAKAPADQG
ncbi:MAG: sulfotransferase family protein [Deltaproteobacteria bacterium]|jgi:hypothetical protein|nr:sulfotransferase family protein [Deltaproteobacteria bacterium]